MAGISLGSNIVCGVSGLLFACGWWLIIDGVTLNSYLENANAKFSLVALLFPFLTTIGLGLLTMASRSSILGGQTALFGEESPMDRVMLFVYTGVVMVGFGFSLTIFLAYHQSAAEMVDKVPSMLIPIGTGVIALRYITYC